MKNKYVMIGGFAFSEDSDMKKLGDYAKKGWILEGISGLFYKLRKDKPQDIEYSLDYQDEATKEYFDLFLEAGWTLVVSTDCNSTHIFSAPVGTKPIYTERISEMDKYSSVSNQVKKGSIYSLIAIIAFAVLLVISAVFIKTIFLVILVLFTISVLLFIPNFMTYLALNRRVNKLSQNKKYEEDMAWDKKSWIIYAILSTCFLCVGIIYLIKKIYFCGGLLVLLGVLGVILMISHYREKKILK